MNVPDRRATVLVVDDDLQVLDSVSMMVEDLGFKVATAAGGAEAIAVFHEIAPDVVLTDIAMPQPDGFGVIRALRGIGRSPKIVAMSGGGFAGPGDVLDVARALGANAVIRKPFKEAQLRKVLLSALKNGPEP